MSTSSRAELRTPNASKDAEWLAWRDPTGKIQDALDAIGAFDDGWVDVGEEAKVMVRALNARGITASLVTFTDPATSHESLAPDDFDRVVEHVLALTRT